MHRGAKWGIVIVGVVAIAFAGYAYFGPKSSAMRDDEPPGRPGEFSTLAKGAWEGADDFHFASGSVAWLEGANGRFLRFENYTAREGPDVYFYLVRSANATTTAQVEQQGVRIASARLEGRFNLALPEDVDLSEFAAVVAWCDSFNVRFGTAVLAPTAPALTS